METDKIMIIIGKKRQKSPKKGASLKNENEDHVSVTALEAAKEVKMCLYYFQNTKGFIPIVFKDV